MVSGGRGEEKEAKKILERVVGGMEGSEGIEKEKNKRGRQASHS